MTTLSLTDEDPPRLALRCSPRYRDRAQTIPGLRFDRNRDAWIAPLSLAIARVTRSVFPDLDVAEGVYDAVRPQAERDFRVAALKDGAEEAPEFPAQEPGYALFPYQATAAECARIQGGFMNQDEKGNGKTPTTLAALEREQAFPTLVVCTNSMKGTWAEETERWTSATPVILAGTPRKREDLLDLTAQRCAAGEKIVLIIGYAQATKHSRLGSYGSVYRTAEEKRDKELNDPRFGFKSVVVDECVPDTTLIETSNGRVPISSVSVGDLVLGVDHTTGEVVWSEVLRTMTSPDRPVVRVGTLWVTPEHPVWSLPDSLCYASLYAKDYVDRQGVRVLRDSVPDNQEGWSLLRKIVPIQGHERNTGAQGGGTHPNVEDAGGPGSPGEAAATPIRGGEPVSVSGSERQGAGVAAEAGISNASWGQWYGAYRPAKDLALSHAGRVGGRSDRTDADGKELRVPNALQDRPSQSEFDGGGGGTRPESSVVGAEGAGQEEAGVSARARVDNPGSVEQGRNGRPLWNLETTTGNYVANGVLVHNCHKIKDPKAKQTRAIYALGTAPTVQYRYALTATPIANHTIDLWGPLHFIDPVTFSSRSKFRDRYVLIYQNPWGGIEDMGLNPATEGEFRAIYDPISIRRPLQVEAKLLPPQYRFVDMEPAQRAAYNRLEKEGVLRTPSFKDEDGTKGGGILIATNPLVLNTRLQQLAAATPVVDQEGNVTELTMPSAKVDALIDLVGEMGGAPLVAFSESKKLIHLAYRELTKGKSPVLHPDRIAVLTGDTKSEDRTELISRFQGGEIDLFMATIGAGSEGITLTRASTMCFLTRSYRALGNNQAEGRLLRVGQTQDVQVIDFITRDTVEYRVHEATQGKDELLQQLVRDPDYIRRFLPNAPSV